MTVSSICAKHHQQTNNGIQATLSTLLSRVASPRTPTMVSRGCRWRSKEVSLFRVNSLPHEFRKFLRQTCPRAWPKRRIDLTVCVYRHGSPTRCLSRHARQKSRMEWWRSSRRDHHKPLVSSFSSAWFQSHNETVTSKVVTIIIYFWAFWAGIVVFKPPIWCSIFVARSFSFHPSFESEVSRKWTNRVTKTRDHLQVGPYESQRGD